MTVALARVRALQENFGHHPGEHLHEKDLPRLLKEIPSKVEKCLNERTLDTLLGVTNILDAIKIILSNRTRREVFDILNALYAQDKEIWDSFKWEDVRFQNSSYHENNDMNAYSHTGITPENLMVIAGRNKDGYLFPIIIKLGEIYGLDTAILLPGFLRSEGK